MIILITGTSRGIGYQLANYYLNHANQVIGISRSISAINHANYFHYSADMSDEKSISETLKVIKREFTKIDVLINNTGIASMNHIMFTKYEMVDKIFRTNFFSTFLMTREISKLMMKQNKGRIVNFSTVAVPLNLDGESIYASSKSAIETFTRISAKELSEFGITVNCLGPSPIKTSLISSVPENKINNLLNMQSIKKHGTFDDVINVINFFISDTSSNITGQTIYLGGVF